MAIKARPIWVCELVVTGFQDFGLFRPWPMALNQNLNKSRRGCLLCSRFNLSHPYTLNSRSWARGRHEWIWLSDRFTISKVRTHSNWFLIRRCAHKTKMTTTMTTTCFVERTYVLYVVSRKSLAARHSIISIRLSKRIEIEIEVYCSNWFATLQSFGACEHPSNYANDTVCGEIMPLYRVNENEQLYRRNLTARFNGISFHVFLEYLFASVGVVSPWITQLFLVFRMLSVGKLITIHGAVKLRHLVNLSAPLLVNKNHVCDV